MLCSQSSDIDDDSEIASVSSRLTTLPCTSIAEPHPPPTRSFSHRLPGWSPDLGGGVIAGGDVALSQMVAGPVECGPKGSSVYMMHYEQPLPVFPSSRPSHRGDIAARVQTRHNPQGFAEQEPPTGFAVPVRPSASLASPDAARIFSPPLPVYRIRANPIHRATFFKSSFNSIEQLDAHAQQRAEWVLPNKCPRQSVLHLTCRTGAVTAVDLGSGRVLHRPLTSSGASVASETDSEATLVPPEEFRVVAGRSPTQGELDAAWCDVDRDLGHLQQLFGHNLRQSPICYTEEELEYQRCILRDYAPVFPPDDAHTTVTEGSMFTEQAIGTSGWKAPETTALDRWLELMSSDESSRVSEAVPTTATSAGAVQRNQQEVQSVLNVCEGLLRQLVVVTSEPNPPVVTEGSVPWHSQTIGMGCVPKRW